MSTRSQGLCIVLSEIRCKQFNKRIIRFHEGLNVVLGDSGGTNSIGKSTLLLIVDFVFGGETLVKKSRDVMEEVGELVIQSVFTFGDRKMYFERRTDQHGVVFVCSEGFVEEEVIKVDEFCRRLLVLYGVGLKFITWRSLIGLHFRIWHKENCEVHHPLHVTPKQRTSDAILALVQRFGKFGGIHRLKGVVDEAEGDLKALRDAITHNVVSKVTKQGFIANLRRIEEYENRLQEIRGDLGRFAANLSEVINDKVLSLKVQKDHLLSQQLSLRSELGRVAANLARTQIATSATFKMIVSYFPEVDTERLERVDAFHESLTRILRKELQESQRRLVGELEEVENAIGDINEAMAESLESVDDPGTLVDRIVDLSEGLQVAREENYNYSRREELKQLRDDARQKLTWRIETVLESIQEEVNTELRILVSEAYGPDRKAPQLTLLANKYDYATFEDTGTGKAFAGLLLFDLAVFSLTEVPCIAHDSLLFKNVENAVVARLVRMYDEFSAQSFIAIDEAPKYGPECASFLRQQSVVQLSADKTLFSKDWRNA